MHSESIASHAIPTSDAGAVSLGLFSSTGEWESLASAIGLGANLPLTTLGSVLVATFRDSSPPYNCSSSRGLSLSNVPVYRHTLLTTACHMQDMHVTSSTLVMGMAWVGCVKIIASKVLIACDALQLGRWSNPLPPSSMLSCHEDGGSRL